MAPKQVGRTGRVFRVPMPASSRSTSAVSIAVSSSLMASSYGRVAPEASMAKAPLPSNRVYRVRFTPQKDRTVAAVSRLAYERAGVDVGGSKAKQPVGPHRQDRSGGRTASGGRPVGTGRNTWQTMRSGMVRAVCAAVVRSGFDVFLRRLFPPPAKPDLQDVFADLQVRAAEYYRGEVWPLRYAFGVLSRFVNGVNEPGDKMRTPQVVTTWLSDGGFICCSCAGRAKHVGRVRAHTRLKSPCASDNSREGDGPVPVAGGLNEATRVDKGGGGIALAGRGDRDAADADRVPEPGRADGDGGSSVDAGLHGADACSGGGADAGGATFRDADCEHARTFGRTISWLCRRLRVSAPRFRSVVPAIYAHDSGAAFSSSLPGGSASVAGEDWDAEGPLEVFRTGQSAVAVVISGLGLAKVVVPVRCTRNVTSCAFCDSAAGLSCVHALRSRGAQRGQMGKTRGVRKEQVGDDGARSRLPISLYNCPASVRTNSRVCELLQRGETFVISAPPSCPKCKLKPPERSIESVEGSIMCTLGCCAMRLESYVCSAKNCGARVFPDGQDEGVVILSASTAATAVIMRDIAREMCTSGSTFGACYRHWNNKYVDLRDSGLYPGMADVKGRSRQTVTCLFFLTVNLMTMDPPLWAFTCSVCQDKDGRWRIITADGIWLGYLKRLASGQFKNATQECTSELQTVHAASLHPSERVRRFIRTALKQPTKAVVIKGEQLKSAKRALWLMCPDALPSMNEQNVSEEKRLGMVRLRALLSAVWDMERAGTTLCAALIVHLKKRIATPGTMSSYELAGHIATLQDLTSWRLQLEQGRFPGAQQHGGGGLAPAGGGGVAQGEAANGNAGAVAAAGANGAFGAAAGRGAGAGMVAGADGAGVPQGAAAEGNAGAAAGADAGVLGGAADSADPDGGAVGGGTVARAAEEVARGGAGHAAAGVGDEGAGRRGGQGVRARGAGGGGGAAGVRAVANQPARGARVGRARAPAANAQRHHMDRTTNEPGDPRCLRPDVKDLGATLYKDISSFCVALAADPVVNMFKPRHGEGLTALSSLLRAGDCEERLDVLLASDGRPADDVAEGGGRDRPAGLLLAENRMLFCHLAAISSSPGVFNRLRHVVADMLLSVRATVEDYHLSRTGKDNLAVQFQEMWGDARTPPEELRRRFLAQYPGVSEDPHVTGAFFPGMKRCRPSPFIYAEEPELGTCAKNYQDAHKYFSPGTFTICCACSHPKMVGFVVLDKREGPPALLGTILSYFALLPHFVVYDFGCGALRSALGKLRFFLALVVLVSDLFHIVNHLCSDALHPRSYTALDGASSVAHEQRNSPINLMRRSLRACGQDEYMSILQLENIFYNVMAHARSTCVYPLHEDYNYRQFYFSRAPCLSGCGYQPGPPPVPQAPPAGYGRNGEGSDSDTPDSDW